MENINKKKLINAGINGLCLFFGLVVFLFTILGEKMYDGYYFCINHFHEDYAEFFYFLFLFLFSYLEILVLFYIRDKKVNNIATHIISGIYSFTVTFTLYLNIDIYKDFYFSEYSIEFSGFVWLLLTIEITLLILTYKETDLRKAIPDKTFFKTKNKDKTSR